MVLSPQNQYHTLSMWALAVIILKLIKGCDERPMHQNGGTNNENAQKREFKFVKIISTGRQGTKNWSAGLLMGKTKLPKLGRDMKSAAKDERTICISENTQTIDRKLLCISRKTI